MRLQPSPGGALERSQESSLADVVSTILEKGVVIDVFARVSLVGIELLRVGRPIRRADERGGDGLGARARRDEVAR